MDPIRYKNVKGYGATIFRKNANQITQLGGLWDESLELYSQIKGALPRISDREWWFRDNKGNVVSKVTFKHIERDADVHSYQGGQICGLFFDELTHFSEYTFFYMLSRNRSACGVRPYVRATCNPDPDSWVASFISWWIDQETGFPIKERSGVIRYMIRLQNTVRWGDSREELWDEYHLAKKEDREKVKSVTFIPALLEDNPALMKKDPGYRANLESLPEVERQQLLYGNWKIKNAAGLFFKRQQATMVTDVPLKELVFTCRAWDIAATEDRGTNDPDYTAGVLMGLKKDKTIVVLDAINRRIKAGEVEKLIYNTSVADRARYGMRYRVRLPQDPGAAGKIVANAYIKKLTGFSVRALPVSGKKELRAMPFAAQWQNGNVEVLVGPWNTEYFTQLESFPESSHDDLVDASSDAFNEVADPVFQVGNLT